MPTYECESNTVTVIDLRTFQPAPDDSRWVRTYRRCGEQQKERCQDAGSNNVSVIDAEQNKVVATLRVHGRPYFDNVSADGKRAYGKFSLE